MPEATKQVETTKRILVTGDAGTDIDVYLHFNGPNPPPGAKPTRISCALGGAGLPYQILNAWAGGGKTGSVGFALPPQWAAPVFAVWKRFDLDDSFKTSKEDKRKIWRLTHSVNPGLLESAMSCVFPAPDLPPETPVSFDPQVVLIHDDARHFRHPRGERLAVEAVWNNPDMFVIWKMSPPFCRGELWWRGVEVGVPDHTAVVLTLGDLRMMPVRISCGISWERTALEISRELEFNPALDDLRAAAHVLVVIHGEGVLWRRKAEDKGDYSLFFDAANMERETCRTGNEAGAAYGFTSTFAAALAGSCADGGESIENALRHAIPNGLHAMRLLYANGHGPDEKAPAFPLETIAGVIREGRRAISEYAPSGFADYSEVHIPYSEVYRTDSRWSIALSDTARPADEPLYGLARRYAVFGIRELRGIPHARFGKLLTADRNEIEALRNLKTLIDEYIKDTAATKPLSLAVFGPPGAGKSFGVKEIARQMLKKDCAILEFNLSQFTEGDLVGALHQVRDQVLQSRKPPVVFWDEFDSSQYQWLRLLLAPMNDGVFQEGQIKHPIGRCIFVFAGGTSANMAGFGPPNPKDAKGNEPGAEAWQQFKLLKGPDFISRIHGSLDVLGPNPKATAEGDHPDVSFPLRRAILLRALLDCKDDERLDMDPGLLSAMLEVGEYTNGARSFEKICLALKVTAKGGPFMQSHLPSDAVLTMNVKYLAEFRGLLTRDDLFQHLAGRLAPAIHQSYIPLAERDNPNNKPYDDLPEEIKADNLAAARRIPWLLGLAGLYVTDASADGAFTHQQALQLLSKPAILDRLAEEEHDQWMMEKRNNGWVLGPRDDSRHVHPLLIPYRDLAPEQQEKDHRNVCGIPERVELAGLSIVARKPLETEF